MRRWWRWILAGACGAVVAGLVTTWLLFQHVPAWYRPPVVPASEGQWLRNDFSHTIEVWQEWLNSADTPFEQRLTQDQINAWLAGREELWPPSRDWLPPSLADPFVVIDEGGLRLAVTYRDRGVQTVLSGRLAVEATADGLRFRLDEVAGGSLGLPVGWLREELAALDRGGWPAGQRVRDQLGGPPLPHLAELFEGAVFPRAWVLPNGHRPFRIADVQFESGAVVLTFDPLPRQTARR